jgi:hypothetical protein
VTSYQIQIKKCSNCACEFSLWAVNSCNTINANFYTDGFIEGPMYDEGSIVLSCPGCRTYFWCNDLPTKKSMRDFVYFRKARLRSLPEAFGLSYQYLLRKKFWNNQHEEQYIRIRAWWSFNELYRNKPSEELRIPIEQEKNLRTLIGLLDINIQNIQKFLLEKEEKYRKFNISWHSSDQDFLLMKAEIFRELGDFGECLKTLKQVSDDKNLKTVNLIKKLAKSGIREVRMIK